MLFHTTQAWPVVVPVVLGLVCGGLAMLDLYPTLRRWLGVATIVAAAELCVALIISRYWFFVVALPVGAVVMAGYAAHLRRRTASERPRDGVESRPTSTTFRGGTIGGATDFDVRSSADVLADSTNFEGQAHFRAEHRPGQTEWPTRERQHPEVNSPHGASQGEEDSEGES